MSRQQFMDELERLLSDIPIEEKEEALQYYNDYFADAGEDQEEEIIKKLGSPARVASIIKADLNANDADRDIRGRFTEKGYEDTVYQEEKYEAVKTNSSSKMNDDTDGQGQRVGTQHQRQSGYEGSTGTGQQNNNYSRQGDTGQTGTTGSQERYKKQNLTGGKLILLIILAIFAIPVIIPLAFSVLGTMFGLTVGLIGVTIGFGIAGVVLIALGIGLFLLGLMQLSAPFTILLLCGAGLMVFGIGILLMIASILIAKILIPALIKGFVYLCRLPFQNRSVTV